MFQPLQLEIPLDAGEFAENVAKWGEDRIRRSMRYDTVVIVAYVSVYVWLNEWLPSLSSVAHIASVALIVLTGILDFFGENAAILAEIPEEGHTPDVRRILLWSIPKWIAFFAATFFLAIRFDALPSKVAIIFCVTGILVALVATWFRRARLGIALGMWGVIFVLLWVVGTRFRA